MAGEPEVCANCGRPAADDSVWVVTTAGPKDGATLTEDHRCPECGAAFWYDRDDPEM